jgi:hypothetical protein
MIEDEQLLHLFRADIAALIRRHAVRQALLARALENWKRKPLPECITRLLAAPVSIRE